MDYISEAERLKLYYKGLSEAGEKEHITAAYPDIVSDAADPDNDPAMCEINRLYLEVFLPLYHKLAYVCNNRFIHEDLPLYKPEPQRVWTAKEIYDALQVFAPYAVPELIRTIGCSSSTMTRLQQAFDAHDEAAFVRVIDTSDCDLLLASCVCEDIWPQIVYYTEPSDEDIANCLDAVASMFRTESHPISRSSRELSEAAEPFFDDGDEENYLQKNRQYNQDLFDFMCEFYRDNLDRFKPKERRQIEPLILKGGGSIDGEFHLPEDYFSFHNESKESKEFFGLHPDVIKDGPRKYEELINQIAQFGYIDDSPTAKNLFAYRFSGRMRPERVVPLEWHGRNGKGYELIYLVKMLTERGDYRKMRRFFFGPDWPKDRDSSYARGADYRLKEFLHNLYTTINDKL